MTPVETVTLALYFFVLIILAVYGWHRYYLVWLYIRHRSNQPKAGPPLHPMPVVTIQLPLYNEMYVADRLIASVCAIDYPRELLEIQVLDDSIDETRSVADLAVRRFAAEGVDIKYFHRTNRRGYKAGALEEGMRVARGEFIAIFDADFLPSRDFLARLMPHFADPAVGMVQARWGHINQDYSLLTKIQSILLDGHFVLEHGGRNRSGRFFNFNGTAGIWRRVAIDDAGGWQHDTLTEDLDLSYRAQLRGWRFVFVSEVIAPAEVPVEMNGFKSQQHRWAKGSIQTCRKLLPSILRSDLPFGVKAEAFFHLTANFNYILMCVLSILMFPAMVIRYNMGWYEMLLIDIPLFFAATFSFCNFYTVCQREIHKDWRARIKYVPFLMSVGIGLSINNTRAVFEALFRRDSEFARTPKYRIEADVDEWVGKKYRQSVAIQPLVELLLGLYFTWTVFYALANQIYGTLPFLVLFQVGFLYTGLLSIVQQYAADPVVLNTQVASGK
ncbi:MAG: glycosyl transferase family 2 [Acidobacteria bacterium]|nr:MAG: glycosyl transferase family 2 [Acidobacteriota bacterium]PYQ88040.1 MAG: glycosyl transferase family 2 [Acidobacteriota bacterium]PYR06842.1 MAG: glycosyl transferase family 2 [Acidobacteriota bacterium]